jgi:radical SAM protein with 4Fe4S-binding SPASM domain
MTKDPHNAGERINKSLSKNPAIAVWELTLQCNLRCVHCGSFAGDARAEELTTTEALHLCQDLAALGCAGVALMGGEVFLRQDWQTIAHEIKRQGMVLSLITNGYVNPDHIIPQLCDLETDCVMVGLDGGSAASHDAIRGVHGSFEKARRFLKAARQANLQTSAITTIHKSNFQELPKILEIILEEDVSWQLQEAIPIGRFPPDQVLTEEEYYTLGLFIHATQKKYATHNRSIIGAHNFGFHSAHLPNLSTYPSWNGCYAGNIVLGIQSNGNIKGCLALSDNFIEGNVRKRSICDIWNDPTAFTYSRSFNRKELGPNCRQCKFSASCKGGCTTRSTSITGLPHNDPLCFYRFEQEKLTCG